MIEDGDGNCEAWADLLTLMIRAHRVDASKLGIMSGELDARICDRIYAKNWDFDEDGSTTAPTEQTGAAGQGTSDPRLSTFPGHWLVKYTLSTGTVRVMDPSYGTGPFDGSTLGGALLEWEDASLDGFRYRDKDEYGQPTGPYRYMPDTKGARETHY